MINHQDLSSTGFNGRRYLAQLFRHQQLQFAGNRKLKIYGTLHCASGKRMKTGNRVFFTNQREAIDCGYRPCGHCMRSEYLLWRGK